MTARLQDRPLASRAVALTTAGDAFSQDLALGLSDAGAAVALLGAEERSRRTASEIESAGRRAVAVPWQSEGADEAIASLRAAQQALGQLDVVVHARVEPRALEPCLLATLDDAGWDICCEAEIRCALNIARAAGQIFRPHGGRLLFVTPTLSHSGAAQHVAYAAACESIRALAKSLARAWGPEEITVNCIAPDLGALRGEDSAGQPPGSQIAALGRAANVRKDIAPLAAALAGPGGHFVTGETVRVDGGIWLA